MQSSSSTLINISVWTSLCAQGHCHAETGKGLPQTNATKMDAQNRIELYAVALRFPFTGTKGPSPNHYSSTNRYSWHYALGQVVFSWHLPNPDSSVGLPDGEV